MRRVLMSIAVCAVGLVGLAACTSGPDPAAQPLVPAATSPAAATTTPADAAPSTDPADAACTPAVLRSSTAALAPDLTTGVREVKVNNCVAGFARLYATPNASPDGAQPEGDQFFLRFTGGQWHLLARGAAIDCGDGDPKLAEACAAFDQN